MILSTKLFPPTLRSGLVARPHLLDQLTAGLNRRLTLVSAPAGFGKTTLVRAWLASQSRPFGWLSLDENDNDPARFFAYFVAALQQIDPQLGASIDNWNQPSVSLMQLTNDIVGYGKPMILILDDYHLIDSAVIHQTLEFLLQHAPPNLHLVLISRTDPPISLARLRVRAEMIEIRAHDLRFTLDETVCFFATTTSLTLSPTEINQLEERTEGWVAGLQMAAIALQSHNTERVSNPSEFIRNFSGSHRYVADYLIDEVLTRQSERMRDFLVKTSILERMSVALIAATFTDFNIIEAQAILEQLDASNLFIVALDGERRWYRYHYLFVQLLQRHFWQTYAEQAADYHRAISQWYDDQRMAVDAVTHAIKGEHFAFAVDLIEKVWIEIPQQLPPRHLLLAWYKQLPVELFADRPLLAMLYFQIQHGPDANEGQFEELTERFVQNAPYDSRQSEILCEIKSFQSNIALQGGDFVRSSELIQEVVTLTANARPRIRSRTYTYQGLLHIRGNGNLSNVWQAFAQAGYLTQTPQQADVQPLLARVSLHKGKLRQAKASFDDSLVAASGSSTEHRTYMPLRLHGLAYIYYHEYQLEIALAYAEQARKLPVNFAFEIVYPEAQLETATVLAAIHIANGAVAEAISLIGEINQFAISYPSAYYKRLAAANAAHLWLQIGETAEIEAWAVDAKQYSLYPFGLLYAFEQIALARYEMNQKRLAEADARLIALLPVAESAGWNAILLELLIVQATCQYAQNNITHALELLGQALVHAEPEGYITLFLNEGEPMAEMLHQVARRGIASNYVAKLLVTFDGIAKPADNNAADSPVSPLHPVTPSSSHLVEPLSNREREILPLLATGLTNREISQQLSIAPSTVERHLANIYGKLQVSNRTQAVARARELDLLS